MYPVWLASLAGTSLAGDQRRAESRGWGAGPRFPGQWAELPRPPGRAGSVAERSGAGLSVGPPPELLVQGPPFFIGVGSEPVWSVCKVGFYCPPVLWPRKGAPAFHTSARAAFLKKDLITLSFTKSCTRGISCQDISTRALGRLSGKARLPKWCWTPGQACERARGPLTAHRRQLEMVRVNRQGWALRLGRPGGRGTGERATRSLIVTVAV